MDLEEFLDIGEMPVFCNVLYPDAESARAAPRGRITLAWCPCCGAVSNTSFDPALVAYSPEYENSLHFSAVFREYAEGLADRLVSRFPVDAVLDIVEIGCGQGDFLKLLGRAGQHRCVGFDASYDGPEAAAPGVRIVREGYSAEAAGGGVDLVCSRHVLEHVEDPVAFLGMLGQALREGGGAMAYVEVPNATWIFDAASVGDLIYEHCWNFSETALCNAAARAGLVVERSCTGFGGQFLSIEARPSADLGRDLPLRRPGSEEAALIRSFSECFTAKVEGWRLLLAESDGTSVVWGAGSKGVSFMNLVPEAEGIVCLIDVNERKQGRRVPGTGHEVRGPKSLRGKEIDRVLMMNAIYEQEIRQQLDSLGCTAANLMSV